MPSRRPNLLYLLSDQHAPTLAGCLGDGVVETPHLDALAERGVVLSNVYCPAPLCVPSRASILTGRHPHENGVWTNDHQLDPALPTLAHALGAGGYRPVLIGRMHVLGPDQLHGYAERLVGDHGPNHPGSRRQVDHGVLTGTAGPARVSLEKSGPGQSAYQVHDEDVAAATVDYLNRLGVRRRAGLLDEPFCLSVGFMLPHQPFVARREDFQRYAGRVPPPRHAEPPAHPYHRRWRRECGIEELPAAWVDRARTAYYGLVHRLDALIGQILTALRENGLEENTLVLYTADHGEQIGEHGLWWKQTFYEDSVKVPTVIAWPGALPCGARCDRVVSSLDLNATMLDALGAPPLPGSHGRSLLPLLRDPAAPWQDVAFSEHCTDQGDRQRMVRRGDWKLAYYRGEPRQLFDLRDDPHELRDRADDPACRDVLERLTAELLDGWDLERVDAAMAATCADLPVLQAWAKQVDPPDRHRWRLVPQMNFLEDP